MEKLLYFIAKALITFLQCLPLRFVAVLGRAGGAVAYLVDGRHRRVSLKNLKLCFPDKADSEVRAIAKENFKRIGENYCCAIKTASMDMEEISRVLEVRGIEKFPASVHSSNPPSIVIATGHFGNFELYARCRQLLPNYRFAATFRGLKQESLTRLLQSLREKSGCLFFERRRDVDALKQAMQRGNIMLGLLSDQFGGVRAMNIPLMGHECSTNGAPVILALRYGCPLFTAICYRVGLGKWRIEVGDEIPMHVNGEARSTEEIMSDVNQALSKAIARDPANWFWVHNRWKRDGIWWKKKGPQTTSESADLQDD